jgi:hypothetical protein
LPPGFRDHLFDIELAGIAAGDALRVSLPKPSLPRRTAH